MEEQGDEFNTPQKGSLMERCRAIVEESNWFKWSYFLDWFFCFFGVIVTAIFKNVVDPHLVFYTPNDPSQSYPYSSSTVPSWALFLVIISPPFIITLHQLFFGKGNIYHNIHHAILAWFESVTLNFVISNVIKYSCGRHRPDYFSRFELGLDASELANGSLSFPSGHSSGSFTAMTFLFYYICGQSNMLVDGQFFTMIFAMSPLYLSTWIAITRVQNYKHNYSDILAGTLLGIFFATIGYFLNFYSVFSVDSAKPKNHKHRYVSTLPEASQ